MKSKPLLHDLQVDEELCRSIERLLDGGTVHPYKCLAGAYRAAVEDYHRFGDQAMGDLAEEAERDLRKLLAQLREQALNSSDDAISLQ